MRKHFRDVEHLVRLGLLFAAGIVLFLVVRSFLVPPGFGQYGHYRPGAIEDNRNLRQPAFAGQQACFECHDALAEGAHAGIRCESCHGALAAHAADPAAAAPPELEATRLCVGCHAIEPARPARHPQVDPEAHAEGAACTDCHDAHLPGF